MRKENRTYYEYKGLMASKLFNKYTQRKIKMTLRRPTVNCTCETWTLSGRDINGLLVFERNILRYLVEFSVRKDGE